MHGKAKSNHEDHELNGLQDIKANKAEANELMERASTILIYLSDTIDDATCIDPDTLIDIQVLVE